MTLPPPYDPATVFAPGDDPAAARARVFIAPQRYVQGEGVLQTDQLLGLVDVGHLEPVAPGVEILLDNIQSALQHRTLLRR